MPVQPTPADALIVGYDGSPTAELALEWAAAMAVHQQRELHIMAVRESRNAPDRTPEALATVREAHPEINVSASAPVGNARYHLVHAADTAACVVLGNRGRSRWQAALLGTVSLSVAMHAHCPVVIIHKRDTVVSPPMRLLVGVDGSATSVAAARFAVEIAPNGAEVRVVMAWPTAATAEQIPPAAQEILDRVELDEPEGVTITKEALAGHPVDVLTSLAKNADLLVMGRRGNEGFTGFHMGSTAQHALYETPCPIAMLPQQD
ncbi:universal stress protein [Enemella sp. A6]|uniref:universal stress protein n=1 Tax=Enemella sp. A6 TaxID=3440152 RepID=UPI003EB87840